MTARPEGFARRHCFSTLGCVELPFPGICELAAEFGIAGLELRGIGGRMDMPQYCAAQQLDPAQMQALCQARQTQLVVAGSSLKLTSASAQERQELLDFCAWTEALQIPYVRVFGGGVWGTPLQESDYARARELVRWWRSEKVARRWQVELLLETHDAFSASEPCLKLNHGLEAPLLLIWDSHHTWRVGGETPRSTWQALGPLIRHVQIKDSSARPSARHPYTYVLPGDGQAPLGEILAVLREGSFGGFVSLEWERFWHPYLPPLREALARLQQRNWFSDAAPTQAQQEDKTIRPLTAAQSSSALPILVGAPAAAAANAFLSLPAGSYAWWRSAAESLLRPLAALMQPRKADLPLRGQASNHGSQADRLESFARPCLLAAHWLASEPAAEETLSRHTVAEWFRAGLLRGTDPASAEYWGPTANHHQHTVEMAALTLAMQAGRSWLWEPLSRAERDQVARWLATIRGAGLHRNNHMFFNVMTLAFLAQENYGRNADPPVMRHLLDVLESMALGGGWFLDGMNETVDYYQAYAFHYYGPWWAKLYGHTDPKRARRWKEWLAEFLKTYSHFFAASGENPPFGRSMCYRFAASAPFGLAEFCGVSAVPPGLARRLCTRNLQFFLAQPLAQEQGALSLGWTDEFPALAEAYTCAGSTYWAAKGFAPLLLPSKHAFWHHPEQPLPAESGDFQLAIPPAGLVVRSNAGAVEVLNNANGITVSNTKFGPWKWGKLSFRSGVGGEIALGEAGYPPDAALTAEFGDGSVFGRHQCQPLAVTPSHCGSVYALGDRFTQNQVSVETRLWWKHGWQLHWHRVVACQKARLRLGTYSLPLFEAAAAEVKVASGFGSAHDARHGIAVQPLLGFSAVRRLDSDPQRRAHLLTWHSLVLQAETDWLKGEHNLIALTWVGQPSPESEPWSVVTSARGGLTLRHPHLGRWHIAEPDLPLAVAGVAGGHHEETLDAAPVS